MDYLSGFDGVYYILTAGFKLCQEFIVDKFQSFRPFEQKVGNENNRGKLVSTA
jgi:hypothetical protein